MPLPLNAANYSSNLSRDTKILREHMNVCIHISVSIQIIFHAPCHPTLLLLCCTYCTSRVYKQVKHFYKYIYSRQPYRRSRLSCILTIIGVKHKNIFFFIYTYTLQVAYLRYALYCQSVVCRQIRCATQ